MMMEVLDPKVLLLLIEIFDVVPPVLMEVRYCDARVTYKYTDAQNYDFYRSKKITITRKHS